VQSDTLKNISALLKASIVFTYLFLSEWITDKKLKPLVQID